MKIQVQWTVFSCVPLSCGPPGVTGRRVHSWLTGRGAKHSSADFEEETIVLSHEELSAVFQKYDRHKLGYLRKEVGVLEGENTCEIEFLKMQLGSEWGEWVCVCVYMCIQEICELVKDMVRIIFADDPKMLYLMVEWVEEPLFGINQIVVCLPLRLP